MENREYQLKDQIDSIMPDIKMALYREVDRIVNGASISDEEYAKYLNGGESFILAKAIISQWFSTEPYGPPKFSKSMKDFFKRIRET